MTLQQSWEKEAKANAVTTIHGYDENEDPRHSAIPLFLDDWFHGDFKTEWSSNLSSALGNSKFLEEYGEEFPEYRVNSVVEIGFDTNGESISDYEVQITDPDDSNTSGGLSPVTLEGGSDSPDNPFRNEWDYYDDDQDGDYLPAVQKGPHTKHLGPGEVTVGGVEGVRGSIIFGGSDKYLDRVKSDLEAYTELTTATLNEIFIKYIANLPAFYTFLDFAFMADGAKAVRVWDASRYPAHALYIDGEWEDENVFREGIEWTVDGPIGEHTAFESFARDGQVPGFTPFGQGGSFGYRNFYTSGSGNHPVMVHSEPGSTLAGETVQNELSDPMFPDDIDNPV
jgi:hypothetical protein